MPMLIMAINSIFTILRWIIIFDAILSFIPNNSLYDIKELLGKVTTPLLMPFRRLQERIIPGLMVDFSPIAAFAVLSLIQRVIISIFIKFI